VARHLRIEVVLEVVGERTEDILAGRNRPTDAELRRDLAERVARFEVMRELDQSEQARRSA
jgi:hypothetical protein